MPRTPDRFPGPREDEAVLLEDQAVDPAPGEIRRVAGTLKAADAEGVFSLRGLTATEHDALDTLVHRLTENAHLEIVRDGTGSVAASIYWTDATKTVKVREEILTRDGLGRVSQIEERQYDAAGAFKTSLTTVLTRNSAGRLSSAELVEV